MNTEVKTGAETDEMAPTLGLLVSVADEPRVSQRGLAERMGVALGLANAYLKRATAKGWIKIRQAPARRFLYYLTPEGFAEKAALTRDYLSSSLRFFRRVRQQSLELLQQAERRGLRRVALVGSGDIAEIIGLSAQECGMPLLGIVDPRRNTATFAAYKVYHDLASLQAELGDVDAVLIADMDDPQSRFDEYAPLLGSDRVLVMPLLHVVRQRIEQTADDHSEAAA